MDSSEFFAGSRPPWERAAGRVDALAIIAALREAVKAKPDLIDGPIDAVGARATREGHWTITLKQRDKSWRASLTAEEALTVVAISGAISRISTDSFTNLDLLARLAGKKRKIV